MSEISEGLMKSNLKRVWTSYRIAKGSNDMPKRIESATSIRDLQGKLGYPLSVFPELNKSFKVKM